MFENPSSLPANPLPPTPGTPPVKPIPASAPANLPSAPATEPEDMFGKTEHTPKMPSAQSMSKMSMPESTQSPVVDPPLVTNRKSILIASLVLGVIILIGGGVLLAKFLGGSVTGLDSLRQDQTTDTNSATVPVITESPLTTDSNTGTITDPSIMTAPSIAPKDTDGDGLNDDEEQILGTSTTVPDTDKDGLSDYDEVRVYQTDPLKEDTDGDTYKDGDEVKNGYNPAGPGKIFGAPSSPSASTDTNTSGTVSPTPTKPPLTESPLSPRQ